MFIHLWRQATVRIWIDWLICCQIYGYQIALSQTTPDFILIDEMIVLACHEREFEDEVVR